MSRVIIIIPTEETNIELTNVRLGITYAMKNKGINLSVLKPIIQTWSNHETVVHTNTTVHKRDNHLVLPFVKPFKTSYSKFFISKNQKDLLIEKVIDDYYKINKDIKLVLIEGLIPTIMNYQTNYSINYEIAKSLNADIIFVVTYSNSNTQEQIVEKIKIIRDSFDSVSNINIIGIIYIHRTYLLVDEKQSNTYPKSFNLLNYHLSNKIKKKNLNEITEISSFPASVIGIVPWHSDLLAIKVIDITNYLKASFINKGDVYNRYVNFIFFCTYNIPQVAEYLRIERTLLVIPVNRPDLLITICLAVLNGSKISGVILTGNYRKLGIYVKKLCKRAFGTGLPVFAVNINDWQLFLSLKNFSNLGLLVSDYERVNKIQKYVASCIDNKWLESLAKNTIISHCHRYQCLTPPAFLYRLTELAKKSEKRIILPEGNERRTIKAATICAEKGIATCILLGKSDEINFIAKSCGVKLRNSIEIIDPEKVREKYVKRLFELRKSKGMTENIAREQLRNNIVLGTMMLEQGEVDGLVSGAVHTTTDTIRPSLQLIKTAPGQSLISSVFFMLLPDQVYVYGDCAINPNPTAEQLAEIAIQSADSATAFGINPFIAMISYSTGRSGAGKDVDKVSEATNLVKRKRPDLVIDGPLQYDAAVMNSVARRKAPNSPVAGKATVFIFPDLNTGNTTYKAVQRTANIISIGPIIQGMRKPVNDLSRGALVDDIIYTIAITAIQATQ